MSAAESSDAFEALSDEPLPEPEYDNLDLSFQDMVSEGDGNPEDGFWDGPQKQSSNFSQYILGTLVVRVVAARDLEPVNRGGFGKIFFGGNGPNNRDPRTGRSRNGGSGNSANPYASVRYCGQAQRTTEVYDTTDPTWPRGETMFFDVSLPVRNMVQEETTELSGEIPSVAAAGINIMENQEESNQEPLPPPPKPTLTVAVFHSTGSMAKHEKYPMKGGKSSSSQGDSDDPFLGMASLDMTQVLTGKVQSFDEWVPLTGTENSRGKVRIVCEYEATDPPPRAGDKVRFTSYCTPEYLYPIPPGLLFTVEEVDGDELILSYNSPEGWLCNFPAHRFMFICEERHQGAIETYQRELANFTERLAYSPLLSTLTETVERVPDDGILLIGANVVQEGASLLTRWLKGGIGTAVGDFVYATNLDGRFNTDQLHGSLSTDSFRDQDELFESRNTANADGSNDEALSEESEPLPGMPCCPITGGPMRDPVVAADGHTYERAAIKRWLQTSNTSPLTGSVMQHKNLVTNYGLVSSLQGRQETASPIAPSSEAASSATAAASLTAATSATASEEK